jgi:hypothetical protein
MRSILSKAVITLAVTTLAALAADNSVGTWKLNLVKSKYTPATPNPFKSLNITREASDGGVKVTVAGEQADGTAVNASYIEKYDGTETQVTGNLQFDIVSSKQENANTFTYERRKTGGSYKATGRGVISNGGRLMTLTTRGTNGAGQAFTSVVVFDKQ